MALTRVISICFAVGLCCLSFNAEGRAQRWASETSARSLAAGSGPPSAPTDCSQHITYDCPLTFGWRVVATTIVVFLGSALANSAGVGGGALWVPTFRFLMGFDVKGATSTSQAIIAAGAGGGFAFLITQRHPEDETTTLVDYSLAAVLTPSILFGVSSGVLLNVLFPDWLLTILLTLLLFFLAYRPWRLGVKMWKAETVNMAKRKQARASDGVSLNGDQQQPQNVVVNDVYEGGSMHSTVDGVEERLSMNRVTFSGSELGSRRAFFRKNSTAAGDALSRSGAVSAFAYHHEDDRTHFRHLVMDSPVTPLDFSGPIPQCFNSSVTPDFFAGRIPECFDTSPSHRTELIKKADPYADADLSGPIPLCFNTHAAALDSKRQTLRQTISSDGTDGSLTRILAGGAQSHHDADRTPLEVEGPQPGASDGPFYLQPLRGLAGLAALWVVLVTLEYFKSTAPGRCSAQFAAMYAAQAGVVLLSSGLSIRRIVDAAKATKAADGAGQHKASARLNGTLDPTYWALGRTAAFTLLAGLVGGMMGIGGGMIIGPLLLELGVHPQVTAATSAVMVLFSSSAATAQLLMLGKLNKQYAALFASAAVLAAVGGVSLTKRAIAATGRLSVIVLLLAAIITTGASLTLIAGSIAIAHTFESGGSIGFNAFC